MIHTIAFKPVEGDPLGLAKKGEYGFHPPVIHKRLDCEGDCPEWCDCGDSEASKETALLLARKRKVVPEGHNLLAMRLQDAHLAFIENPENTQDPSEGVFSDLVHPFGRIPVHLRPSWTLCRAAERLGWGTMICLED